MFVQLPSMPNDKLSDELVKNLKNFNATWISEKEAIFSTTNTEKELKKIFDKFEIKVIDKKCDHISHSRYKIKNNKKVEIIETHKVIKNL